MQISRMLEQTISQNLNTINFDCTYKAIYWCFIRVLAEWYCSFRAM